MPTDPASTAAAPARIHADRAAQTLQIEWRDGHETTYDFHALRWLCPCATCRGEGGQPGWLDSGPILTPTQTTLIDVRLVGAYALQPTWADGHATGFYSFTGLRDSCPCDACRGRREADALVTDTDRRGHHQHSPS